MSKQKTKKKIEGTKFILIKDNSEEYTLIGEDGGFAGFHHNGEHIIGTYYGRIDVKRIIETDYETAVEDLLNADNSRSLFDFEGKDDFELGMAEEVADWMIAPRDGEFYDNLKYFKSNDDLSESELIKFLKKKRKFYEEECGIDYSLD